MDRDAAQLSITIFAPQDLDRSIRSIWKNGHSSVFLYGWSLPCTSYKSNHFFVIAGAQTSTEASLLSLSRSDSLSEDNVTLLRVGEVEEEAKGIGNLDSIRESGQDAAHVLTKADLYLPGRFQGASVQLHIVQFEVPKPAKMRYLSLEPMVLSSSDGVDSEEDENTDEATRLQQERLESLVRLDPLRFADLTREYDPFRAPGEPFRRAIDCINEIAYIQVKMSGKGKRKDANASSSQSRLLDTYVWLVSSLRSLLHASVRGMSAVAISACARQLHLRLGQVLVWPTLARKLRYMRVLDNEPVSIIAPRYTALYNGIWLVANDIIIGQAVGVLLCENHKMISNALQGHLHNLFALYVVQALRWLDSWPLGVKLNTPLSRFFADMYVGMTEFWSAHSFAVLMGDVEGATLAKSIYVAGIVTRLFGFSMLLCLCTDTLRLLTVHLTTFYHIQRSVYAFFCSSTISLFHLFRGKKRNRLRGMRVDDATYELDQLLLGTLFFTLLLFLWLTVATYYAYFALLQFALVTLLAVLQAATATVNHLPLFALMLRCKDPARLPGGVAIVIDWQEGSSEYVRSRLINKPLTLGQIFSGQSRHLRGLRSLPRTLLNVVLGRKI